jgi:2-polyprenyl-3-methyl-5-hydroxy-6-metoxy-1,4-benzoquinol methylase
MKPETVTPRCPLCSSLRHRVLDRLTRQELLSLWAHLDARLCPESLESFQGASFITLHACRHCGLRYFHPLLPGNAAFYRDLENQIPDYYPRTCPAFERILVLAAERGIREVLDLGCGAGSFLDRAREAGLETHGLDLNAQAAERCREKGHDVFCGSAGDYAEQASGRTFGLVTAFEVLEHLADPRSFFGQAARLVASAGFLAVAVPNDRGVHALCSLEPHQWPPHHLSRWRARGLRRLGEQDGLEVVSVEADRLHATQLGRYISLQRELERALGRRAATPRSRWPGVVASVYRLAGVRRYTRLGLSLHALYRKPAGSG